MIGDRVPRRRESAEDPFERIRQPLLRNQPQADAAQRDAELRRGDGARDRLQGGLHRLGPFDAAGHHLLDARLADGYEGELDGDEEAVQHDQDGQGDQAHDRPPYAKVREQYEHSSKVSAIEKSTEAIIAIAARVLIAAGRDTPTG